jgi:hypothetical protein
MSYGPNLPDQFRRVAHFVDKILRGAKPAEINPHGSAASSVLSLSGLKCELKINSYLSRLFGAVILQAALLCSIIFSRRALFCRRR